MEENVKPDGYSICLSFNGDCFGTDCPKAKRLEKVLSPEIIEIIKENI